MANGIIDPFSGFKAGSEQLRQTIGSIAKIEQGARQLDLQERRLEQEAKVQQQNIDAARVKQKAERVDFMRDNNLISGEQFAEIINNDPELNPLGVPVEFRNVPDGDVFYNKDTDQGFGEDKNTGEPFEFNSQTRPDLVKAFEVKEEVAETKIEREAEIKKDVAGPQVGQDFRQLALEIVPDGDVSKLNKEQVKAINERLQSNKLTTSAVTGTGKIQSKVTIRSLEESVVSGKQNDAQFQRIFDIYQPEFSTIPGKLGIKIEQMKDVMGLKADTKLVKDYRKWYQRSKNAFLKYRKWVTGVAGGEKEFAEIAKAFVDADAAGPATFLASLEEARDWGLIVTEWSQEALDLGLITNKVIEDENGNKQTIQIPDPDKTEAQGVTITNTMNRLIAEGKITQATIGGQVDPGQGTDPVRSELDAFYKSQGGR